MQPEVCISGNKKRCPKCGSRKVLPIIYGYPSYWLFKRAERGKVELGGCCITPEQPERKCRKCGFSWRAEE